MIKYLIPILLTSLSLNGLSQRTAEFVSIHQPKEGQTTMYEFKLSLSDALSANGKSYMDSISNSSTGGIAIETEGSNILIRSKPEFTTGELYANLFKSLEIDKLIYRDGDNITELEIESFLKKNNR